MQVSRCWLRVLNNVGTECVTKGVREHTHQVIKTVPPIEFRGGWVNGILGARYKKPALTR